MRNVGGSALARHGCPLKRGGRNPPPADLNRRMLMGIDYERAIEKFRKWHNMNEYQEHNARRCLFYSRRSDSLNLDDDIQEKVRYERVAIGYFNMILVAESEKYIPK